MRKMHLLLQLDSRKGQEDHVVVALKLKPKFMPKLHKITPKIYYTLFLHHHIQYTMHNHMFNPLLTHNGMHQLLKVILKLHKHTETLLGQIFDPSQIMK